MFRNKHIGILFGWGLLLLSLFGCSVTQHLPPGEILYTGTSHKQIDAAPSTAESKKALAAAENALNVAPNNSLFGSSKSRLPLPIGLWFYSGFVNDSTWVGKKIFKMFAAQPVLISRVNPPVRAALARNILREHGYFRSQVSDTIIHSSKDSLQARVRYHISLGEPFSYDTITYLSSWDLPDGKVLKHEEISELKKGQQFNLQNILRDRQKVVSTLRENGYYYYNPKLINYQVDTMDVPSKVVMKIEERREYSKRYFQPWTIGDVSFMVVDPYGTPHTPTDSVMVDGIRAYYHKRLPIRKEQLSSRLRFRKGLYYSQELEQISMDGLSRLGAFSGLEMIFTPQDTLHNVLALQLKATLDKPWDMTMETTMKTKSNNFIGPGVDFALGRRNVFRGGEQLSAHLFGSYEWLVNRSGQTSAANIHSYELGTELSLTAPTLFFPGLNRLYIPYITTSSLSLSASMLRRARYFSMNSVGLSASYTLQPGVHKHVFSPIRLQYKYLSQQSDLFKGILQDNPILQLSLGNQFIPQISYSYTYDNTLPKRTNHHFWFEAYVSEAGNLLGGVYALAGKPFNEPKTIVGVPFAQFVKSTAELRYTYTIDPFQSLACRVGVGAIFSYGNSKVAPYSELFYVGGANSIRAFSVRSLGPGSYSPANNKYAFMDQAGEFKLELNAEYRIRLAGQLHGAIFLDTGNVWLLNKDPNKEGGSLGEIRSVSDFFNQMALGSGIGLRYDLNVVVIRLDLGVGIHLPYETAREGYYNIPNLKHALGLHLAVGYPF